MSSTETEIIVEDPDAPAEESPSVTQTRTVEATVYVALVILALLLGFDNWRTGMGWASDGPQAGYFPFYLSVVLAAASLFGLVTIFMSGATDSGNTGAAAGCTRAVPSIRRRHSRSSSR